MTQWTPPLLFVREPFKLEGGRELIQTLGELTKPVQRNAMMRTLKREIQPLADAVKARAPYDYGDLQENYFVGTRLTRRQRAMSAQMFDTKATAELHFGTADPAGMMNEFGLGNNPVQAHFRPEWEGRKHSIRDGIAKTLGNDIVAAGVRAAKRRAKVGRR